MQERKQLIEDEIRINEQLIAEITFQFEYNGDRLIATSKIYASLLSVTRMGDLIEINYDPIRDKLFIVAGDEE